MRPHGLADQFQLQQFERIFRDFNKAISFEKYIGQTVIKICWIVIWFSKLTWVAIYLYIYIFLANPIFVVNHFVLWTNCISSVIDSSILLMIPSYDIANYFFKSPIFSNIQIQTVNNCLKITQLNCVYRESHFLVRASLLLLLLLLLYNNNHSSITIIYMTTHALMHGKIKHYKNIAIY